MATKTEKSKDADLIQKAKDCLEKHIERESDNIRRAEEAIRFRALEQWPEAIKQDREDTTQDGGPRPCPIMDKTNQYVRQVVNEERQGRAAIKIRPVDDVADLKVAEVFTGIIRHVEDRSQAIEAYTTGGEQAIDGGFGYWRLLAEYSDPMSFEQDIRIKRIPNRFSVALGPHTEADGADAPDALIWEDMSEDQFKAEYPKAKIDGFDANDAWKAKDIIRVAEYMYVEREPITIHMLDDGTVVTAKELNGRQAIDTRQSVIKRIKWIKITAQEILEREDMLGTYIPVIKVIGNELCMPDGKIRLSGALETMMDPQRVHNFAHAGFIENVALAPRSPWLAEEQQVEGYESEFAQANRRNITMLRYKAAHDDSGQALPLPQRIPPPGIPIGWDRMLQNTEHAIEASIGMYGPSVGAKSQEKSGIALQEQKAQGMVGNYHFPDNLARSIQHTGRILLEWIPGIYDTERIARMLGEDGEQEMAHLNPDQEQAVEPRLDQMGEEVGSIYNLNVGKYDVTVSTGPSYTAKRQEAAESQMQLIQAKPELLQLIGDIVFGNMDWPGANKISDRMKAMLPPEIKQMEASQEKGLIDPKVQAMMAQIEQASRMMQEKEQQLMQAEQELRQKAQEFVGDRTELDNERVTLEANRKVFMAEAREKQAQLELNSMKLMDEIEAAQDEVEKVEPKDNTYLLGQDKLDLEKHKHDREMDLKEYEASMKRDDTGQPYDKHGQELGTMKGCLSALEQQLSAMTERMEAPKELIIKRDKEGEITSVRVKNETKSIKPNKETEH